MKREALRNVAVIAHVDHGKTTLVDELLKQSGIFQPHERLIERVMDSNDLERERGITILAKNTAVQYFDTRINIVDTPGHADFGGEVERILGMVDGALLIVDAVEGPMPQTRFVLRKALEKNLRVIVVVNKIDRAFARPMEAVDEVLDLFMELGASEEQCDFPYIFASGVQGYATDDPQVPTDTMQPLFEMIVHKVPAPHAPVDAPMQLQVANIDYDDYLGHIGIGRLSQGLLRSGTRIAISDNDGERRMVNLGKLYRFQGLKREEILEAQPGDIVAFSGVGEIHIGETLVDPEKPMPLPPIHVDEPTLQMTFSVNDSPFAGREGEFLTSRHLRKRLYRETLSNLSLRVADGETTDSFYVSGRGELHLGILIETMRREGFEFQISRPRVILKEENGQTLEPIESLVLDVTGDYVGSCIEALGRRKGEMVHMETTPQNRSILKFTIPARGLIGFASDYVRLTKGEGIMYSNFDSYQPYKGDLPQARNGTIWSMEAGTARAYSIQALEDRGLFFISPGTDVYVGMIIGEHNRPQELPVNICKAKKLTNMRAAGGDDLIPLKTPRTIQLEEAMSYIQDDELIEVTPKNIRLRKKDAKR
ncbi:MAG: translational GTPase TypA [Candidatus Melainabacteria bacterium HGW-Melainabacteria-1]|nr:MAG: translational GTPase TypA [Candidatus Melainabacteria bacterium HGW-Melainabacteria-1]